MCDAHAYVTGRSISRSRSNSSGRDTYNPPIGDVIGGMLKENIAVFAIYDIQSRLSLRKMGIVL